MCIRDRAKMSSWRPRVPAAEAKKAESASGAALRIPSPPSLTGRQACSHWRSDKSQLVTIPRLDFKWSLKVGRAWWRWQGVQHRMCWILGAQKQERSRRRASWDSIELRRLMALDKSEQQISRVSSRFFQATEVLVLQSYSRLRLVPKVELFMIAVVRRMPLVSLN